MTEARSLRVRGQARAIPVLAALGLVGGAAVSRTLSIVCNTISVLVLAALMRRSRRQHPGLLAARTWLLAALLVGVLSGVVATVEALVESQPRYPGAGDLIELLYLPCTLAALMLVPLNGQRLGYRARALGDGLVAATSLLYLIEPLLGDVQSSHTGLPGQVVALSFPLGDVVIVAAALTSLARCADAARPVLRWLALGLSLMAAADLAYAVAPQTADGARHALFQVGLTALLGAVLEQPRQRTVSRHDEAPAVLAALPFLPFAAAVCLSTSYVLKGKGLDQKQLVLAIAVGLALVLRQYVGSRDKTRLVDELAGREARLHQELRTDPLTGVANRLGLEEALHTALALPDHEFGLVVIDLDDFKLINDNHGHAAGDVVLRQVAVRLSASVRGGDVVARLGGDEFAVLLNGHHHALSAVSDRLVEALAVPVVVEDRKFRLNASIGLVGKEDGDTVGQLLADADGAMYEAKTDRSASSLVRLDRAGRQTVAWRSQVREQVAHPVLEQFAVVYQPVVDLRTGELRGVEALLRWHHPLIGPVPPDVFIPLAEQCGSIAVLGDFVLTTAVRDLAAISRMASGLVVGVNVSPRQLASPGFFDRVSAVLAAAAVAPDCLAVEITEQAFEADLDAVQHTVRRLISGGVQVAVDDFGTGYSSLRYLQRLDLTMLKVDRSFVAGIGQEGRQERLLDGIAALAQRMSLQLIAEGIETPEQLAMLRDFGCELGQGYLFSPPLPFAQLVALVESHHRYAGDNPVVPLPHPRPAPDALREEPTG
jgi:diguanylate cyclase (GGDEF)-like protein